MKINGKEIKLSNTDKIFFPKSKITKGDVIEYYRKIADYILPHLKDRPLSIIRYPDGIGKGGFFQKDMPDYFPDWITCKEFKKESGTTCYVLPEDAATLVYLANLGTLVLHPWLSTVKNPKCPDRIIFDLDPSDEDFGKVVKGAKIVKALLDKLNLPNFPMITGSRGLHITIPIQPEFEYDKVKAFARSLSEHMAREHDIFTVEHRKNKRGNKIFIDYLRNEFAQTAVSPFSIRAIEKAPVAVPIEWKEVKKGLDPQKYNISNIFKRLGKKSDSWQDFFESGVSLKSVINK